MQASFILEDITQDEGYLYTVALDRDRAGPDTGHPLQDLPADAEDAEICMHALLLAKAQRFGSEVWLGPFLRDLNDHLPYLDNRGRKRVVNSLVERGAIKIETKAGDLHPYSYVTINWNDPCVQKLHAGAQ